MWDEDGERGVCSVEAVVVLVSDVVQLEVLAMLRWQPVVIGDSSVGNWETPVAMHLVTLVGVLPVEDVLPILKV